jgi:hypothetical protein
LAPHQQASEPLGRRLEMLGAIETRFEADGAGFVGAKTQHDSLIGRADKCFP